MFKEEAPQEFGNFFRGFYSLFGVAAYGRWPDNILQAFILPLSLSLSLCISQSLSSSDRPYVTIYTSLSHAGRTTICRHSFSLSLSIPLSLSLSLSIPLSLSLSLSPTLAGQQSAGIQRGRQPKCRDHHIHLRLRRGHCDRVVAGEGQLSS